MMFFKKIKAGALQFVLFIGTIIVLMLFAFILIHHSHSLLGKKSDIIVGIVQKADQGLLGSFSKPMKMGDSIRMVDEDLGIQTNVIKKYWGLLEMRNVVSKKGKIEFKKTAFVGYEKPDRPALYLKDANRPLVIAGNSKITGDAYLPERGIKMGNIGGYGYVRPQMVYGNIFRSDQRLPQLCSEVVQNIKSMIGPGYWPKGNKVALKHGMVLKNGFQEESIVIQGMSLNLENISLTGNILVWATERINVKSTSRLRDVILIAPTIEIDEGTRGSFQAISGKEILVGKHCELDYPSILAVQRENVHNGQVNNPVEPAIQIGKGARISGSILYLDKKEANGNLSFIRIDEGAVVHGEIYCEQSLEVKGSVHGTVTTGSFVSFENGYIYLNHLFNGKIDAHMLPDEYCGLSYDNKTVNGVVKWIY